MAGQRRQQAADPGPDPAVGAQAEEITNGGSKEEQLGIGHDKEEGQREQRQVEGGAPGQGAPAVCPDQPVEESGGEQKEGVG